MFAALFKIENVNSVYYVNITLQQTLINMTIILNYCTDRME